MIDPVPAEHFVRELTRCQNGILPTSCRWSGIPIRRGTSSRRLMSFCGGRRESSKQARTSCRGHWALLVCRCCRFDAITSGTDTFSTTRFLSSWPVNTPRLLMIRTTGNERLKIASNNCTSANRNCLPHVTHPAAASKTSPKPVANRREHSQSRYRDFARRCELYPGQARQGGS